MGFFLAFFSSFFIGVGGGGWVGGCLVVCLLLLLYCCCFFVFCLSVVVFWVGFCVWFFKLIKRLLTPSDCNQIATRCVCVCVCVCVCRIPRLKRSTASRKNPPDAVVCHSLVQNEVVVCSLVEELVDGQTGVRVVCRREVGDTAARQSERSANCKYIYSCNF